MPDARPVADPVETLEIELEVNGRVVRRSVPVRRLLVDFLRDDLRLTGTHVGCEHGVCGACTVEVDGAPARACIMLAVQADGKRITTIEALSSDGELTEMQRAFHRHHALQCGFCTPGFLVTLHTANPDDWPDEHAVRELLSGNLCRCTGYQQIVQAVLDAWGRAPGSPATTEATG
ncbi:MAG TPA: (2Fe-2S)-binding protein [Acidimicrobiales bacterium]|jgi:carbon-monoxide dehydrogenase small subunit|nr:(2Fe-2S)-binding protein [Acidimicrobiales bacterium]